jgi:hypothetical protein
MAKSRPCEICMKPIEPSRLEALNDTRLCEEHARQIEKYGGEFLRSFTTERTSKEGSLKRNYGGINVSKRRNQKGIDQLKDEFEEEKWKAK